ncbi:BTB/POZ domain [Dillenia turbinata]|uniref:BTB/POZ domain n=1 Tax=Dillenia turbinata TaxID=194707 RepID=A0AAN8YXY6_9MAGN
MRLPNSGLFLLRIDHWDLYNYCFGYTFFAGLSSQGVSSSNQFPTAVIFYVQGRPIEAHRVILSACSRFFKKKFVTDWKDRKEVRFAREKLSYPALYSLIHFFYSDRLEIAVDDMEDLIRICKVCKCDTLQRVVEKEVIHQKYAKYKALSDVGNSQKRFILQGLSLPEDDRLPAALHQILQDCLDKSTVEEDIDNNVNMLASSVAAVHIGESMDDLADICIRVDKRLFRCHQDIDPDQISIVSPKRAVADLLLPHFELASPAELFQGKAFDTSTTIWRFVISYTAPSAPGAVLNTDQGNLLDDLREKWLEAEAAELDKRDESALHFDKRLEMLMLIAEREKSDTLTDDDLQEPS